MPNTPNLKNTITSNELKIILQKYNKSFTDKCNITKYIELSKYLDNEEGFNENTFRKKIKEDMQKLSNSQSKGMRLKGTENTEYFIYPIEDSLKIERKDNAFQNKTTFSINWNQCASLIKQLVDKNMFMSKQENDLRIFSSLLLEKYSGHSTIEINLSNKKKEVAQQLMEYFKNLYVLCNESNNLTKYNTKHNVTSIECFKNKILIDKDFCDGIRRILKYEFDIVPLNYQKTEYIKKLIPCAVFLEDISQVRKKCDIYKFVNDWVVYQNEDYQITGIVDKDIELTPAEKDMNKITVAYKQFKSLQSAKKELNFQEFSNVSNDSNNSNNSNTQDVPPKAYQMEFELDR